MKHIFVVNPCAGKSDSTRAIQEQLEALGSGVDCDMYVTQAVGDATRYVRERCAAEGEETLRFYACGGDGTLNEVLSGLVGCARAELAAYPCGSGNDYIKYYGTAADFLDLRRLMNGTMHKVDVMQVGDRYSLNVCNFGFDALVCKTMDHVRRWPLLGGSNAYTTGILRHILTGRNTPVKMRVDGEDFYSGRILLCTLANGSYVGGKYCCAPYSHIDDGLLEINLFRPMSIPKFASLIGSYADGTYPTLDSVKPYHRYRRGKEVEITSPRPLYLCIDGEVLCDTHFLVRNMPRALTFVAPQGC